MYHFMSFKSVQKIMLFTLIAQIVISPVAVQKASANPLQVQQGIDAMSTKLASLQNKGWRFYDRNLKTTSISNLIQSGAKEMYFAPPVQGPTATISNLIIKSVSQSSGLGTKVFLSAYHRAFPQQSIATTVVSISPAMNQEQNVQNKLEIDRNISIFSAQIGQKISQNTSPASSLAAKVMNWLVPSAQAGSILGDLLYGFCMLSFWVTVLAVLVVAANLMGATLKGGNNQDYGNWAPFKKAVKWAAILFALNLALGMLSSVIEDAAQSEK